MCGVVEENIRSQGFEKFKLSLTYKNKRPSGWNFKLLDVRQRGHEITCLLRHEHKVRR